MSLLFISAVTVWSGCAYRGSFQSVEFTAPSTPDPRVQPVLNGVERLGVLCTTDIEPFPELDIQKVLTRLGHAVVSRVATGANGRNVVPQDDILWHLEAVEMDSAAVISSRTRQALADSMDMDALIVVELERLQARTTPVTPGPYGFTPDAGLDLAIQVRMSLINLHSGQIWQQTDKERQWKPVRVQLSGRDQSEQQLLLALGRPLHRFLSRIAPPPTTQKRAFDLGGR